MAQQRRPPGDDLEEVRDASCFGPMRPAIRAIRQNFENIVKPIFNNFVANSLQNIQQGGPTYVYNAEYLTGTAPPTAIPFYLITLTSGFTTQVATANIFNLDGSTVASGAEVSDFFDRWSHAESGHQGIAFYNGSAFIVLWLNTVTIMWVPFTSGTLRYDDSITIEGKEIFGANLVSGKKVVGGSGIQLTIYYDHQDKKWYAITVNKCAVNV